MVITRDKTSRAQLPWLPSLGPGTPFLAQGQSYARWPDVHSLTPIDTQQTRLESGVCLVRALPTPKNVSKVPGYSRKWHVNSDASSSSSYKSAQVTLNRHRKRAKTEAESDNAASGQQVRPEWPVLRYARTFLSMLVWKG
jgi:hypothetical protein